MKPNILTPRVLREPDVLEKGKKIKMKKPVKKILKTNLIYIEVKIILFSFH